MQSVATEAQIAVQLRILDESGFFDKLTRWAATYGLPPMFVFAIASRETNCLNMLGDYQPAAADGLGRQQPHGVGIMQVDIQHQIAREMLADGTWRTQPDRLIAVACNFLADDLATVKNQFPNADRTQQLKIVASAYNCGLVPALEALETQNDSDALTTHQNYGADVIARMAMFAELVGKRGGAPHG